MNRSQLFAILFSLILIGSISTPGALTDIGTASEPEGESVLETSNSGVSVFDSEASTSRSKSTSGDLEVTVRDEDGYPKSGATVVLYDDNWNRVDSQSTNSNGQVYWSGLSAGNYHLEAYYDDEFWTGGSVDVTDGTAATITLRRSEPYEQQTDLTDQSDGDGTISIGDTVNIATEVWNDKSYARDVRVKILIDTNTDDVADTSVTRGPLTISSNDNQWYGVDFTPESSGTHQVRIKTETYIASNWVTTDDTGWYRSFEVQSNEGSLDISVDDESGNSIADARVVLYDGDWNQIDTRYTDSSGDVSWSALSEGTYQVETYVEGQFWGGSQVAVESGSTTTESIRRYEPYETSLEVSEQGDGDGVYEVGETAIISPQITNDASGSRSVRVQILVDTDNDGNAEQTVTRGPLTIDSGDVDWFGYEHAVESSGTHQVRVQVETEFDGSWVQTDDTGWQESFDVESDEGSLEVAINDETGDRASDVEVVLYDGDWNQVDTSYTTTDGVASWSNIETGTYYIEIYSDGQYWGGSEAKVESSSATSVIIQRHEPYADDIEIVEQDDGDGRLEVGDTITVSPSVRNDADSARSVRVQIHLDADNDGTAEQTTTRGPLTVASSTAEWYGYEHEITSSGIYQVRVEVETEINGNWVTTADTGWNSELDVEPSKANLEVSIEDHEGSSTSDATAILYDEEWSKITTRQTNSTGQVAWTNISPGTYHVEVYHDGDFWGATELSVNSGETVSKVVQRQQPLVRDSGLSDAAYLEGDPTKGDSVNLTATVENPSSGERDVRVVFLLDSDGDGTVDETILSDQSVVTVGERRSFSVEFTPSAIGTHRIKTQVETRIDDGWVRTDSRSWGSPFEVVSGTENNSSTTTGGFRISAVNQSSRFVAEGEDLVATVRISNPHQQEVTRLVTVPHSENSSSMTNQTVTLGPGESTTRTFVWTPRASSLPSTVALRLSQSYRNTAESKTTVGSVIVAEELVKPTVSVVRYADGEPVKDAEVTVTGVGFIGFGTDPSYEVPDSMNGTEIEPGVYEFGPLPRNLQLSVLAEKPGYKPTGIVVETGDSQAWGGDREITIPRYVYPTLAVEAPNGDAVSGVEVELSSQSYPSIDGVTKETNENGLVSLGRVPNGTTLTIETPRKHDESYFVSTSMTVHGGDVTTTTATPLEDPSGRRENISFGPTPDPGKIADILEKQAPGSDVDERIEKALNKMSTAGVQGTKVVMVRGSVGVTIVYANVTEWRQTGSKDAYLILPNPTSTSGGVQTLRLADEGDDEVDKQLQYLSTGIAEGLRARYSAKRSSEMDSYLSEEIGANVYVDRDSAAYKSGRFITILAPLSDYGDYKRAKNRGQTNKVIWSGGWVALDAVTLSAGGKIKAGGKTLYRGVDSAIDGIRSIRKVRRFKAGTKSLRVTGKEIGRRVRISDGRVMNVPQIVQDQSPRSIGAALRFSDEIKKLSLSERYRFVKRYYDGKATPNGENAALKLVESGTLNRELVVKAAREGIDLRAVNRLESNYKLSSGTIRSYVRGGVRATDLNALLADEVLTVTDVAELAPRVDPTTSTHVGAKWTEIFAGAAQLRKVDGFKSWFRKGDDSTLHQLKNANAGGLKGIPNEMTAALRFGTPQIRSMGVEFSDDIAQKIGKEGEIDLILSGDRLVEVKSSISHPDDVTKLVEQMEKYEAFAKYSDRVDSDARRIVVVESVRDKSTLQALKTAARENGFEIIYRSSEETQSVRNSGSGLVSVEDGLCERQGNILAVAG